MSVYNDQDNVSQPRSSARKRLVYSFPRGFTLIELLVVLAIVAVLLMVATPNYDSVINNSRVDTARMALATSVALARSEAVKRATTVSVCSDSACDPSSGPSWSAGWRVIADNEVVQRSEPIDARIEVDYDCGGVLTFGAIGGRESSAGNPECTFTIGVTGDASTDKPLKIGLSGRVSLD